MRKFLLSVFLLLIVSVAFAHGEIEETEAVSSLTVAATAFTVLILLVFIAYHGKAHIEGNKKTTLYVLIVIVTLSTTAYIAGGTVLHNIESVTDGPVHWHADLEIWGCGEKLDMMDPEGLENRVGTSVFHEHGDDRIHVEGTPKTLEEVSLHEFFEVIGGELEENILAVPTNDEREQFINGAACDSGEIGFLQVFVYKTDGDKYYQEKLTNFEDYVLSPYSNVPPGDCIIIEFGEEKEKTDHLCTT